MDNSILNRITELAPEHQPAINQLNQDISSLFSALMASKIPQHLVDALTDEIGKTAKAAVYVAKQQGKLQATIEAFKELKSFLNTTIDISSLRVNVNQFHLDHNMIQSIHLRVEVDMEYDDQGGTYPYHDIKERNSTIELDWGAVFAVNTLLNEAINVDQIQQLRALIISHIATQLRGEFDLKQLYRTGPITAQQIQALDQNPTIQQLPKFNFA